MRLRGVCRVSTAVCLRTTAIGRRDDGATAYRPACSCRTRTSCLLPMTLSRHERSAVTTKVFEKTFFDTKVSSRNLRFHVLSGEFAVFPRGAAGWAGEVGAVDGSGTAGGRRGGRRCLLGDCSACAGARLLSTARVCDSSASGRHGRRRPLHPPWWPSLISSRFSTPVPYRVCRPHVHVRNCYTNSGTQALGAGKVSVSADVN